MIFDFNARNNLETVFSNGVIFVSGVYYSATTPTPEPTPAAPIGSGVATGARIFPWHEKVGHKDKRLLMEEDILIALAPIVVKKFFN